MNKHINFIKWVKEKGSEITKTRLVVYEEYYRGLKATTDIYPMQEIFRIPVELNISSMDFEATPLGKKIMEANLFHDEWAVYIFPLLYVMEESLNPTSKFKPWLDVIPKEASEHPMFFSKEEKEWIKGTPLLPSAHDKGQLEIEKAAIEDFYKKVIAIDPSFASRHSLERFIHMYFVMCSRFFSLVSYNPKYAFLFPYADMANMGTSASKNATWDYESTTKCFKFVATKNIKKGEEIYLSYGHSANIIFFSYYGFTLNDEEYACIGFLMVFEPGVPHYAMKAKLLHQVITSLFAKMTSSVECDHV